VGLGCVSGFGEVCRWGVGSCWLSIEFGGRLTGSYTLGLFLLRTVRMLEIDGAYSGQWSVVYEPTSEGSAVS
jgi:hypothetical protein